MVYKIAEIARDVRIAMDQNQADGLLLSDGDADTLSVDEIIRSKVEEAARRVIALAPSHLLEEGHHFGEPLFWADNGSGWILLPDDFMRLIAFRMSDWERTVYVALSSDDARYQLQSSRYKGLRGTVQKPVCAIVNRPEGKALEFYSCRSEDAQVEIATYIPYPRIDAYGGIDISERCYSATVYMVAALTCISLGALDKANVLSETAKSILQ